MIKTGRIGGLMEPPITKISRDDIKTNWANGVVGLLQENWKQKNIDHQTELR